MSNDLISRKALIEDMRSRTYIDKALCEIFETVVDDAPTAYDADAVCDQIQNVPHGYLNCETEEEILEIVRNGGMKG